LTDKGCKGGFRTEKGIPILILEGGRKEARSCAEGGVRNWGAEKKKERMLPIKRGKRKKEGEIYFLIGEESPDGGEGLRLFQNEGEGASPRE